MRWEIEIKPQSDTSQSHDAPDKGTETLNKFYIMCTPSFTVGIFSYTFGIANASTYGMLNDIHSM